jgi:hypothetical protein
MRQQALMPAKGPPSGFLEKWVDAVHLHCVAYAKAATNAARTATFLVLGAAFTSAVASISVFSSADEWGSFTLRIVAGILSALSAGLAVVQNRLNYEQKASR